MESQFVKDQQLLGLITQPSKGQTLLQSVGYDMDGPYSDPLELVCTNDENIISIGGQSVGENRDFTITLEQEMSIHSMMTCGIAGKLVLGGTSPSILNTLQLFEGTASMLGSKQMTQTFGAVYQQLNLALLNKAEVEPFADGLWLDIQDDGQRDFDVTTRYDPVYVQKLERNLQRADLNFFVPLWTIFPWLKSIEQGALYSGQRARMQFSVRTTPFRQAVLAGAVNTAVNQTYSIEKVQFVYQYARLDPARNDIVLKSDYIYRPIINVSKDINIVTASNNLSFTVSRNERVKRLIFAFCSNKGPAQTAVSLDTNAHMFAVGGNQFSGRTSLFPKVNVQQVEIDIGGERQTIACQSIPVLHMIQPSQTHNSLMLYEGSLYSGPWKDLHCVYAIDLSRFPEDLVGSSNKESATALVNISINTDPALNRLISTTDNDGPDGTELERLSLYAFLEKSTVIHLTQGQYR